MTTQSKPKPKPQLKKKQTTITTLQVATYNVRTLSDNNQLNNLEEELKKVNWKVIGFSEMRCPGEAVVELPNNNGLYNGGNSKNQGGVGFLIHEKLQCNIEGFKAISDRVASVVIRISKRYKIKLIQVYAPKSVSPQEELDNFYDDLYTATQNNRQSSFYDHNGRFQRQSRKWRRRMSRRVRARRQKRAKRRPCQLCNCPRLQNYEHTIQ